MTSCSYKTEEKANPIKRTIQQNPNVLMHGYAAKGFEEVKNQFIRNFTERGEIGASCCIYYKGEKVVALWGGYRNKKTKEP